LAQHLTRVSLSGICPDNETHLGGLNIRKNTGLGLVFWITRPHCIKVFL
jgi:hypothetical protein